jgi:hypothetical protein
MNINYNLKIDGIDDIVRVNVECDFKQNKFGCSIADIVYAAKTKKGLFLDNNSFSKKYSRVIDCDYITPNIIAKLF